MEAISIESLRPPAVRNELGDPAGAAREPATSQDDVDAALDKTPDCLEGVTKPWSAPRRFDMLVGHYTFS